MELGCFPLHEAATKGYVQCLTLLLDEGFDANEVDRMGYTPVHFAAQNGKLNCLKVLEERGGDLNFKSFDEKDALAFSENHPEANNWVRKKLGLELIFEEAPPTPQIDPKSLKPSKPPTEEDATPMPPEMEGHLWKSSGAAKGKAKGWQKRWFLLRDGALFYFKHNKDPKALNAVRMRDVQSATRADDLTKKPNSMRIVTPYRTFFCYAQTEGEVRDWVQALNQAAKHFKTMGDNDVERNFEVEGDDSDDEDEDEDEPLQQEEGSLFGFLFKSGGKNPGHWQKRWVVLDKFNFMYYRKRGDPKPAGILPLTTLNTVQKGEDVTKKEHSFVIVTPERTFYFYAQNAAHCDQWIKAIEGNRAKVKDVGDSSQEKETAASPMRAGTGELSRWKSQKTERGLASEEEASDNEPVRSPLLSRVTSNSHMSRVPGSPVLRRVPHGKIVKEGFMWKTPGSKRKPGNWQRRWFVFREDGSLSYYKQPKDAKPAGAIDMSVATEVKPEDTLPVKNAFHITTPDRVYYVYASSSTERDSWIEVLMKGATRS